SSLSSCFFRLEKNGNDATVFFLRKVFRKEKRFKKKFAQNYKAKRQEISDELIGLLNQYGGDGETIPGMVLGFIDIFDQEIIEADKHPASTVADINTNRRILEEVLDIKKLLSEKESS